MLFPLCSDDDFEPLRSVDKDEVVTVCIYHCPFSDFLFFHSSLYLPRKIAANLEDNQVVRAYEGRLPFEGSDVASLSELANNPSENKI